MTVIICVDDQGGILFNRRRVSSDRQVIADIMSYTGDSVLHMNEYSAKLFSGYENICISDDCITNAAAGDICFLECSMPEDLFQKTKKVVLYHWNRMYPSDVKFPLKQLRNRAKLLSRMEFEGHSHQRITREVYTL